MDIIAAQSWIHPSNYPYRDYQKSITETALLSNTMVCLPTGLGKTLIAAVVMYNYYLWFPRGLIIFMAPTKPLVSQQIEACHSIVGIPEGDTAHLFGAIAPQHRERYWHDKRVVFCTPQSLENDLKNGICDPRRIVCMVFDEAHRATGNYAYCQIVKFMESRGHTSFRVLALTATPGNNAKAIQNVIYNLKIASVEVRGEDDEDVVEYTNLKQIEIVKCKPSATGSSNDFAHVKALFHDVLRPLVSHLYKHRCFLSDSVEHLTELVVREGEQNLSRLLDDQHVDDVMGRRLAACLRMVGCFVRWKLKLVSPSKSAAGHVNSVMSAISGLLEYMVATLKSYAESTGDVEDVVFTIRSEPYHRLQSFLQHCVDTNSFSSARNEKLEKLEIILEEHFRRHNAVKGEGSTRAIVFCLTRATVQECVVQLSRTAGVKAVAFVGQAGTKPDLAGRHKAITQCEQEQTLETFRTGIINVLVATCIAEEGLDVGEVDLIVCYDSVSSPLRLLQRMGRTGRKRAGRVVMLVIEGKDAAKLDQSGVSANSILNVLKNSTSKLRLNKSSPRMLPDDVHPFFQLRELSKSNFDRAKVGGLKPKLSNNKLTQPTSTTAQQMPLSWSSAAGISSVEFQTPIESGLFNATTILQQRNCIEPPQAASDTQRGFWESIISSEQKRPDGANTSTDRNDSTAQTRSSKNMTCLVELSPTKYTIVSSFKKCLVCGSATTSIKQLCQECLCDATDAIAPFNSPANTLSATKRMSPVYKETLQEATDDITKPQSYILKPPSYPDIYLNIVKSLKLSAKEFNKALDTNSIASKGDIVTENKLCFLKSVCCSPSMCQSVSKSCSATPASPQSRVSKVSPVSVAGFAISFWQPPAGSHDKEPLSEPLGSVNFNLAADYNVRVARRYQALTQNIIVPLSDEKRVSNTTTDKIESDVAPYSSWERGMVVANLETDIPNILTSDIIAMKNQVHDGEVSSNMLQKSLFIGQLNQKKEFLLPSSSSDDDEEESAGCVSTMFISNFVPSNNATKPSVMDDSVNNFEESMIMRPRRADELCSTVSMHERLEEGNFNHVKTDAETMNKRESIKSLIPRGPFEASNANRCAICTSCESEKKDPLVQCSGGCGCLVHISCYGFFASPRLPWSCESCRFKAAKVAAVPPKCELCKCSTGMLRRAEGCDSHKWAHPICVIFTPELTLDTTSMRPNNLGMINCDRDGLCCSTCRRFGACIQCSFAECRASIHPYCAFLSSKQLVVKSETQVQPIDCSPDDLQHDCFQSSGQSQSNGSATGTEESDNDDNASFSYHYFCDLHLKFVHVNKSTRIVSSILPLPSTVAVLTSRSDSKAIPFKSAPKAKCASGKNRIQVGNVAAHSPKSHAAAIGDGSPSYFQDTPETIEKNKKAHVRRNRLQKLSHKSLDHASAPEENLSSKKRRREEKKKERTRMVKKLSMFVEDEASCSQIDSETEDGDCSQDVLSGDFINDGLYTQASPQLETGMSMYHALHKNFVDDSPDIVAMKRLLGARGKRCMSRRVEMPVLESILCRSSRDAEDCSGIVNDTDSYSSAEMDSMISDNDDSPIMFTKIYRSREPDKIIVNTISGRQCPSQVQKERPVFSFPSSSSSSSSEYD